MSTRWMSCGVLLAAGALAGCLKLDDLPLESRDGGGSSLDDGGNQTPDRDAEVDKDWDGDDAAIAHEPDSGLPAVDAGVPAAPVACDLAHPCAADSLCAPDGLCLPKCDAHGVCVVASSNSQINAMVADGSTLYFVSGPSRDALGNARQDAQLFRLTANGEQTKLADLPEVSALRPLQVYGGYVHLSSERRAWRVATDGASPPQRLYPSHVDWDATVIDDGQLAMPQYGQGCTLEIGSADGTATPREVASFADQRSCSAMLFTQGIAYSTALTDAGWTLFQTDLATADTTSTGLLGIENLLEVRPPYVYFQTMVNPSHVHRRDLRDPARPHDTVHVPSAEISPNRGAWLQLHGDWLYQASAYRIESDGPNTGLGLVRASMVNLGVSQTIVPRDFHMPRDFANAVGLMAVSDSHAFFAGVRGNHDTGSYTGGLLFAAPLPNPQ